MDINIPALEATAEYGQHLHLGGHESWFTPTIKWNGHIVWEGEDEVISNRFYGSEDHEAEAQAIAEDHLIARLKDLFA